jgi:hypothetical protein
MELGKKGLFSPEELFFFERFTAENDDSDTMAMRSNVEKEKSKKFKVLIIRTDHIIVARM